MLSELLTSSNPEKYIQLLLKQNEHVREVVIEEIQDLIKPINKGNLWIRGSLVRGHFPCGDIDISDYSEGKRFDFREFPNKYNNLSIEYAHIGREYLEDFLVTYLRYSASANEMIPLTGDSDGVGLVMQRAASRFYNTMTADYALFRFFEEEKFYRTTQISYWDKYRQLKEIEGGKRTSDRIFWLSKCLYTEYRGFHNQLALIYQMLKDDRIPEDVGCALFDIGRTIRVNPDKYRVLSTNIYSWYQNQFLPLIKTELISKIPTEEVEIIYNCRDCEKTELLDEIFNTINSLSFPHRQWLAVWVLSQNPHCSQNLLTKMWGLYSKNISYTNVSRNILRHQKFSLSIVQPGDIEDDSHLIKCFKEVCQNRQFTPCFTL